MVLVFHSARADKVKSANTTDTIQ